jgi:hypothetical protein
VLSPGIGSISSKLSVGGLIAKHVEGDSGQTAQIALSGRDLR